MSALPKCSASGTALYSRRISTQSMVSSCCSIHTLILMVGRFDGQEGGEDASHEYGYAG
jgi:hypothetical protein